MHKYVNNAIAREKEIKGWRREKKINLIQSINREMKFLNEEIFDKWPPDEIFNRAIRDKTFVMPTKVASNNLSRYYIQIQSYQFNKI